MDTRVEKLIAAIENLRELSNSQDDLVSVKDALNSIFLPDAKCKNFIYTFNTDKIPFGCVAMPVLSSDNINNFLIMGERIKFTEYEIELDSKMFDYGLSNEDVACLLLYNIYHLVADFSPADRVREMIDSWLTNRQDNISIKDSIQYQAILAFGLYDALNQMTSCLYLPDEVVNDPFLESLGLDNFEDALEKVYREIPGCENEINRQPKLAMLDWALRLYTDVEKERIPAIRLLTKAKTLTASVLYINRMNAVINALNRIDTSIYVTEASHQFLNEAKRRGFVSSLKYNGLRDLENDLYEFMIRAKNSDTEDEVFYALKQINARLAILDDYIKENPDDPDIERWMALKMQYMEIRDKMARQKVYHHRSYGIFVDYNKLDQLDKED